MSIPAPLPRIRAFEKLGYGLFLHWGLHALVGRGVWGQAFTKTPPAEYEKLMERFTAEDFDACEIAAFARRAGSPSTNIFVTVSAGPSSPFRG